MSYELACSSDIFQCLPFQVMEGLLGGGEFVSEMVHRFLYEILCVSVGLAASLHESGASGFFAMFEGLHANLSFRLRGLPLQEGQLILHLFSEPVLFDEFHNCTQGFSKSAGVVGSASGNDFNASFCLNGGIAGVSDLRASIRFAFDVMQELDCVRPDVKIVFLDVVERSLNCFLDGACFACCMSLGAEFFPRSAGESERTEKEEDTAELHGGIWKERQGKSKA